jgi:hypothetical protein
MVAFLILFMLLVALLLHDLVELFLLSHHPDFARQLVNFEKPVWTCIRWFSFFTLSALWLLFIGSCLAGSSRELPVLTRLARRPRIVRLTFALNSLGLIFLALLPVLAIHAISLTRTNREGAAVYVLYDEAIPIPRWAWAVGFYRITSQAQRKWGADSTVLERLNQETLRTALTNGKVLIFATHGSEGYLLANNSTICIGPPAMGTTNELDKPHYLGICALTADKKWSPWEMLEAGHQLRLVYVAGCDSGKKAAQWTEHLSPARVITFNRLSSLIEHAYWVTIAAPAEIKQLQ